MAADRSGKAVKKAAQKGGWLRGHRRRGIVVDVAGGHEALDGVGVVRVEHGQVALSERLVVVAMGRLLPSLARKHHDQRQSSGDIPSSGAIVAAMTVAERRQRDRARRRQAIITAARQMAEAEGWDAVTPAGWPTGSNTASRSSTATSPAKGALSTRSPSKDSPNCASSCETRGRPPVPPKPRYENSPGPMSASPWSTRPSTTPCSPSAPTCPSAGPRPPDCKPPSPSSGKLSHHWPAGVILTPWPRLPGARCTASPPSPVPARLRPDHHQARLTMLVDQLAGMPAGN